MGEDGNGCGFIVGWGEVEETGWRKPLEEAAHNGHHKPVPDPKQLHFQSNHLQSQHSPGQDGEADHCQGGGGVGKELDGPLPP